MIRVFLYLQLVKTHRPTTKRTPKATICKHHQFEGSKLGIVFSHTLTLTRYRRRMSERKFQIIVSLIYSQNSGHFVSRVELGSGLRIGLALGLRVRIRITVRFIIR